MSLLAAGQMAEVIAVAAVPDQAQRLGELGLRKGAWIQMVRNGSPCIVRLDNSRLCFREGDMMNVLVRAEPA